MIDESALWTIDNLCRCNFDHWRTRSEGNGETRAAGVLCRVKLNRISRGIKWYFTRHGDTRGRGPNHSPPLRPFSPHPFPVLNLGVNVTVGLYDFRIDGLAAWNARK